MNKDMKFSELKELGFGERAACALELLGMNVIRGEIDRSPVFITMTVSGDWVPISMDADLQEDEMAWEAYVSRTLVPPWCVGDWQDLIKLLWNGEV